MTTELKKISDISPLTMTVEEFEVQKNDEVSERAVSEGQKWDEMLVILTDYDYADWMVWIVFWHSLL